MTCERFQKKKGWLLAAIPVCMLCLFVTAMARSRVGLVTYNHVYYNYSSIFVLGIASAVFLLLRDVTLGQRLAKVSTSMAECSLGIYLVHWLVLEALRQLAPGIMSRTLLFPALALLILLLSWGIVWICMKIPVVRGLFTLAGSGKGKS